MGSRMSKKKRHIKENIKTGLQIKDVNPFRAIKIGLLGDEEVGKTSICNSFVGIEFQNDYLRTIGSEKFEKKINLDNGKEIKLVFWDGAGQERFRTAVLRTVRNVEGIILVFNVIDKNSFANIERWLQEIKENFITEPIIILFANKVDEDKEKWKVSIEEIETVAKKYNWDYFLISAKNCQGINEGFNCIANKIYNKRIKN